MKLVTFDAGRVGRLDDGVVVELDCASTREYNDVIAGMHDRLAGLRESGRTA